MKSAVIIPLLSLGLGAQTPAQPDPKLRDRIMVSSIDPSLKPLPLERWKTAVLPPIPGYPEMSRMAGIEGELLMHCEVNAVGKIVETKLVSGPPQLASTFDKWLRGIQFKPLSEDGSGPWHYSVSAKFSLPARIQFFPSAVKLLTPPAK